MNKKLYIKRDNQIKELKKLKIIVDSLESFLKENEKKFKRIESVEALKKIRLFFEKKQKEYLDCENKAKEMDKELYCACSHEVSIKHFNLQYHCLICDHVVSDSLISIDISNDYKVIHIIESIFNDVVYSDKDLIETISEKLEEIQYDRNIKVYRR